jgi:tetratricopeptide (TPR) repeat protein
MNKVYVKFDNLLPLEYSVNSMKKKVLIIVSIICGVLLLAGGIFAYFYFRPPTQAQMDQYEQILSEGNVFLDAREYSSAVSKYNDAIKIVHIDKRAYINIVNIYLSKGDYDTATAVANKAQNSLSASDASVIFTLIGDSYLDESDYYNARLSYELAHSLNSNPRTNLGLAKAMIFNKDIEGAKDLLKGNFDNDTSDEAKLLYAYLVSMDDRDSAVNIIDDYEIIKESWEGYFDEYMSVLTSLNEDELYNLAKLSRVYLNNGYPTLVVALLEPKVDEMEQYVDGLFILGKAYLDCGEYENAVNTLLKSVSLLGYESTKYWMLARAYYYQDDLVNSTKYYDRAIGYSGDDINDELVREYLNILIESNQNNKAQTLFSSIVDKIDKDWIFLLGVELYYNANNQAKANYYLGKLSSLMLADNIMKEYLFWDLRISLDSNESNLDSEFEELLALDMYNPYYYWLKGIYDRNMGDTNSAINNFENALEYDLEGEVSENVLELLAQLQ